MKRIIAVFFGLVTGLAAPTFVDAENLPDRAVDRLIPKFPLLGNVRNEIVVANISTEEIAALRQPTQNLNLRVRPKAGVRLTTDRPAAFLEAIIPTGTQLFEIIEPRTNTKLYCTIESYRNFRKCFGDVNNDNIFDYAMDGQTSSQGLVNVSFVPDTLRYGVLKVDGLAFSMAIERRPHYEILAPVDFETVTIALKLIPQRIGLFDLQLSVITPNAPEAKIFSHRLPRVQAAQTSTLDFGGFTIVINQSSDSADIAIQDINYDKTIDGLNGQNFSPIPILIATR